MNPVESAVSPHEMVAEEVRAQLARRRLSGRKAATALGWSEFYLSRRLTGKTPFDVNDLVAIAKLLNVQVTAFFGEFDLDQRSEGPALVGGSTTVKYYTPTPSEPWNLPGRRFDIQPLPDMAKSAIAA